MATILGEARSVRDASTPLNPNIRSRSHPFRLTRVRIASQAVFFVLFVLAVWATWTSRLGGYPVSRLLELDPLVTLSAALATGYVYKFLGWGLLLVVVTFVFGRVFCNWMCPYGTLHQLVSWLFDVRGNSQRIRANGYHRLQYLNPSLTLARRSGPIFVDLWGSGNIIVNEFNGLIFEGVM